MQLDADKAELFDGSPDQSSHPRPIVNGVDECETKEPIWTARDNPRNLLVRDRIVGMERGEENGVSYAGLGGANEIFV